MGNKKMTSDPLDATFAALADATRRAILARLALGEASVNELAAPFSLSQPTISKHLKVLERAGLITQGRDAQRRPRRLVDKPLEDATAWLKGYRKPGALQITTPGEHEITMRRVFIAPRRLVFEAFTKPELLRQWFFGPPGGSLVVCEVALKAGQSFRYVWRSSDGTEMGMSGVCREISTSGAPRRDRAVGPTLVSR
ncbi:MAG TPA: metalloregulator ArsR/SmtB family transcription factor [Candidatus Sulfotelmatobacter sp.]|nr:metalloregulator ArsR/SmtB family transcription factor [Candidatus Sulfotelmatobacter sp.]